MTNEDMNEILELYINYLKEFKKSKIMSLTEERGYDMAVNALADLKLEEGEDICEENE